MAWQRTIEITPLLADLPYLAMGLWLIGRVDSIVFQCVIVRLLR